MFPVIRFFVLVGVSLALIPTFMLGQLSETETSYQTLLEREANNPETESVDPFVQLVALKSQLTGFDEYHATIAMREDLAALLQSKDQSSSAILQLRIATSLALANADAATALRLHLAQLAIYVQKHDGVRGTPLAKETIKLAEALGDQDALVRATLDQLFLQQEINQSRNSEHTYTALLALAGVDELIIKLHRARRDSDDPTARERREPRWLEVAQLASDQQSPAVEAEAWENLAWIAYHDNKLSLAAERFKASDRIDAASNRLAHEWTHYIRLFEELDQSAHALTTLNRELAKETSPHESGLLAELHDARARLLATAGDFPAAYESLRKATELRAKRDFVPQFIQPAKLTMSNASGVTEAARVDAAILAVQREADLALAHVNRQLLIAIIIGVALLLLLTATAYHFKQRAAEAEALLQSGTSPRLTSKTNPTENTSPAVYFSRVISSSCGLILGLIAFGCVINQRRPARRSS